MNRGKKVSSKLHSSNNYISHSMSIVKGKAAIRCQVSNCDYKSDKNSNFKRHFETMHFVLDAPKDCCNMRFFTKGEFRHHSKSVHKEGHRCKDCKKQFNRKALLERHMAIHTGICPFECSKCDYKSPSKANVKRHLLAVHKLRIQVKLKRVNQSDQCFVDELLSLSNQCCSSIASGVESSFKKIEEINTSQIGRSSFSSTRPSSACSTVTIDADDKLLSTSVPEDLVNPKKTEVSKGSKKGRISHSIESILGHVNTKNSQSVQENHPSEYTPVATVAGATYPEEIVRKLKPEVVRANEENWTKINEETNTNWSHLSPPYPMSLQNPSSSTPTSLLSSSSAAVQQFPPSYVAMMDNHHQYSMSSYPYYSSIIDHDTAVVSHNGNQATPGLNNNVHNAQQEQGKNIPIVPNLNQDSWLVPGFLPELHYNSNRIAAVETFVSKTDLIHLVDPRAGIIKEGAIGAYDYTSGCHCCQEKVRNTWDNGEFIDSKKRVHEELFMNESPPVPPQEFVNGNMFEAMIIHAEVDNHYIPKKLRLSKKFEHSNP